MSTSPIAGASLSSADLIARIKKDPTPFADITGLQWGYKSSTLADQYLGNLDRYQGATVGDIVSSADKAACVAEHKIDIAAMFMAAGTITGLVGGAIGAVVPSPLAQALGIAGIAGFGVALCAWFYADTQQTSVYKAQFVGGATEAWGALMAAETKTPPAQMTQPAPAPAAA